MWPEVAVAKSEERREIVLHGKSISDRVKVDGIDPALFSLDSLNFLEISAAGLTSLSDDVGNLSNLTTLVVHSNQLSFLPSTVCELKKLKILDVSRNCLEELPEDIAELVNLTSLNASNNKLKKIPSLYGVFHLGSINAAQNELEEFPEICNQNFTQLSEIKLNGNKLKEIPEEIGQLQSLRMMDLSDNNLQTVPVELSDCSKLKELNLKNNTLTDKRFKKLVEQCHTKQVMDYIKNNCQKKGKGGEGKGKKKGKRNTDASLERMNAMIDELRILKVSEDTLEVRVDPNVSSVRAHIVCCIVTGLHLQEPNLGAFIKLQTKLHESVCGKRSVATIATHDLGKISASTHLVYEAKAPDAIMIKPLFKQKEVSGKVLFENLRKEAEAHRKQSKRNTYSGIHKYLHLLEGKDVWPCLRKDDGEVISFPPITNSDVSSICASTTDVFIEVTSATSQPACKSVMDTLLAEMLKLRLGVDDETSKSVLQIKQVRITDKDGNMKVVYPSRADLQLDASLVNVNRL